MRISRFDRFWSSVVEDHRSGSVGTPPNLFLIFIVIIII
jgi:hypothetical protein